MPTFNELDEIATDSNGKLKKLNKEQLESIRESGFVLTIYKLAIFVLFIKQDLVFEF